MEGVEQEKKPLVSVVIPTFNGGKTIEKTLGSVLGQSYGNLEVIIVDDISTDNTLEIIKSFDDSRVVVSVNKTNFGAPVFGRNFAIKECRGKFLSFCDQDDVWFPEKIEKQITAYLKSEKKDQIGILVCSAYLIDEDDNKIDKNIIKHNGFISSEISFKELLIGDFITACSAIIPMSIFKKVGFLNENLKGVDDYDLWLRITKEFGILSLKEPLCFWRISEGQLSEDKTKLYSENEKIFFRLEKESGKYSKEIKEGHGRNLMRIFVSQVLKKDFTEAHETLGKAYEYKLSGKANFITKAFRLSNNLAYILIKLLQKTGKISL